MIRLGNLLRLRRPKRDDAPPALADGHHPTGWNLDDPLLYFSNLARDIWRIRDACEGTQIFGATGSGKTSGSGRALAHAFLRNGFGGLVLCAKPDEPQLWKRYAAETGRERDIVLFSQEHFNFLHYEANRPGAGAGQTENLVTLFTQVAEIANQRRGHATADVYWERAVKQLLRNAIDLLTIARGAVTLPELFEIVRTAPQDANEAASASWQKESICYDYIQKAADNATKNPDLQPEYAMAAKYWLEEFPRMDNRPRSSIVSLFTTMADSFLRGTLRKLFSTETTIVPEHTTLGRIIIVDLPVKEWNELGQYAAVLMKFLTQKALERRTDADGRPVFIWADEAHYFTTDYDQIFQTTARASRACTVYLTQSYSNYLSALGGESARPKVDSLLGNLQTKIFHQNSDTVTNQWAAELIGRKLQYRFSSGSSETHGIGQRSSTTTEGEQQVIDLEIQPREFTMLWKGGTEYRCLTRAIIFQGGRIWANGKTWKHVVFNQE